MNHVGCSLISMSVLLLSSSIGRFAPRRWPLLLLRKPTSSADVTLAMTFIAGNCLGVQIALGAVVAAVTTAIAGVDVTLGFLLLLTLLLGLVLLLLVPWTKIGTVAILV